MLVSNKAKVLLFALCLAVASICQAIGFGELKVYSYLGEPLYAEIEITGYEGFDVGILQVGLADAKAFVRAGMERPYFLTSLVFQIINYNDAIYIVVRTSKPVKSPFLEFLIELSWPGGNLIKEYTILLDPPPSDLSKESRPKSAGRLAEEQKSSGTNENGIQQQLIQQIAQQQKAQAQESLKSVVKEGDNKFSDQTFDTKEQPKVPAGQTAAGAGEAAGKTSDYQTKRQEYQRKLADEEASKQGGTLLQSAALGLNDLKSELKPDVTVEQILADEYKEQANAAKSATTQPPGTAQTSGTPTHGTQASGTPTLPEDDVTFKNVIKPAGKQPAGAAQRLASQTAGSTAVVTAPQTGTPPVSSAPAEAPPSKGGHMYLGMILSLLLIGAGIAIALKRGMLSSTFAKRNTTSPEAADSSSLDEFDEFAEPRTPSATTTSSAAPAPPVSEDVPLTDHPNDQLLDAAMEEFARPEEQDVEQIELTALPTTPVEAPAAPIASVTPETSEVKIASPPATDPIDATLDQIEQEFENIDLDDLAPPAPEPEATLPKEEPMQAAEVLAPLPQERQSTPEEPIIPEPVPSIEPVSPPMSPPPEEPYQEPQEVPQPPTTPESPPETAGPKLSAENTSMVAEKEEVAFKGPTLMSEQGASLKLSEEGATLSIAGEDSGQILDTTEAIAKKISLAKQYIDTGDNQAAKELLQEVIETANDDQKLEAQLLLTSIS